MNPKIVTCFFTILVTFMFFSGSTDGAVLSVDIGSEWLKVAIVAPGVPMDIVLNKESKRKTPMTIAYRNDDRIFGEDAQNVGVLYPKQSFSYFVDLLGKSIDNPVVQNYKKLFPFHDIIADEKRNTIKFKFDEETTFTPEELVAQILAFAKTMAQQSFPNVEITRTVITVPAHFNQAERRAVAQAAELADLRSVELMNDHSAAALNYGIFRPNAINDTAQYFMFYDMGASKTTATVVSYQTVKTKEKGFVETHPHVSVLGLGYNRKLGGLPIQVALQNYLAQEFDKQKKTKESVFKSPRAMAKLFKEARRVKEVLSANTDHYAQIEGLLDDKDFRHQVTREKLEELTADLLEKVSDPVRMALDASALTMDLISQVVLVGGGSRMPKVQEILSREVGRTLSKNINADEAVVMGAVYRAADHSTEFKVKKFVTKDAVLFPIQVIFEKNTEDKPKQVKRMLFGKMNAYPQKKIITFNKRKEDFDFLVTQADVDHLPEDEFKAIGSLNLMTVSLTGVAEAFEKHMKEGAECKGIKAHFQIDESGVLKLINVEHVAEKTVAAEEKDEGTFSKLGSTISKLFSGSEEAEAPGKTEEQPKEDIKPVHEEPEAPSKPEGVNTSSTNDSKPEESKASEKNQTEKVDKKPTVVILKEPISFKITLHGPQPMDEEDLVKSREFLRILNDRDATKMRRENVLNELESFIINTNVHLGSEEFKAAANPTEIEEINKACAETKEWFEEEGFDAPTEIHEEKLKELKTLTNDLNERVREHRQRPEVMSGMSSLLNVSNAFLSSMKAPQSVEIFTAVEIETLEKVINDTNDYNELVIKTTSEAKLFEPIKYKVVDIANKMALLDREVKYLLNKLKIRKPTEKVDIPKGDEKVEQTSADNETDSTVETEESSIPTEENETQQTAPIVEEIKPKADSTEKMEETKGEIHQEL